MAAIEESRASVATRFLTEMRLPSVVAIGAEIHRAFRSETGMIVSQWFRLARLEVPRELLDSGTRPTDVASRVGYARVRSFSRAFPGHCGNTSLTAADTVSRRPALGASQPTWVSPTICRGSVQEGSEHGQDADCAHMSPGHREPLHSPSQPIIHE